MTKVYFQTHGCSTNISESEIMMGLLKENGFEIISEPESSDIIIINICTVKGEETAIRDVRKLIEGYPKKRFIVAGCLTKQIMNESRKLREDISFISTHNIKAIVEVVEEVLNNNMVEATGASEYAKIDLPKIRRNPVVGIIPILNGCANYCSYCSVKYVKGKLCSYPAELIKKEAIQCLHDGCKEIWVTSQDNAAYMLETEKVSKLPELINEILSISKDFYLRIGMMNPGRLMNILEDMVEIFKNKKVFKFLHIPVQSGNDRILKLMKRKYTVEEYKSIVKRFRDEIPNIALSTDIIVGFPTETADEFNDSLNLIKEIRPDVLNISRFQARPGTDAAKLDGQIEGRDTKERSRMVTEIFLNIARMNNERWIGWEGGVLIDERGKDSTWIGRNLAYRPVIINGDFKLGDVVKVKIKSVTSFDLRADII